MVIVYAAGTSMFSCIIQTTSASGRSSYLSDTSTQVNEAHDDIHA